MSIAPQAPAPRPSAPQQPVQAKGQQQGQQRRRRQQQQSASPPPLLPPTPEQQQLPLSGLHVYLHGSIPLLRRRAGAVQQRLRALGATSSTALPAAAAAAAAVPVPTHVVMAAAGDDGSDDGSSADGSAPRRRRRTDGGGAASSSASSGGGGTSAGRLPATASSVAAVLQELRTLWPAQQQQHSLWVVVPSWLDAVLSSGQRVEEAGHCLAAPRAPSAAADSDGDSGQVQLLLRRRRLQLRSMPGLEVAPDAPLGRFALWLGSWPPHCNAITNQVELVLHARFSAALSSAVSPANEMVRGALKELQHFEEAIGGRDGSTSSGVNHEALSYSRTAAVVRGCAFPLTLALQQEEPAAWLEQRLPLVGPFTAGVIVQLLQTGSCAQLDAFRANREARNGGGELRPGSDGGAVRALFCRLPGVGAATAAAWYRLGLRSYAEVLEAADATTAAEAAAAAAAAAGGDAAAAAAAGGNAAAQQLPVVRLSRAARHSLQHARDLTEPLTAADVEEIEGVLRAGLAAATGHADWTLQLVGGGRRGSASHDADWLATHARLPLAGVAERLAAHLWATGRLVRPEEGTCMIQRSPGPALLTRVTNKIVRTTWLDGHTVRPTPLAAADGGNFLDKHAHIWGIAVLASGVRRRFDLIFVPSSQWAHALLGWTGSRTFLRLLRQAANARGMHITSHFIIRELPPDEVAAAAAAGQLAPDTDGAGAGSGAQATAAAPVAQQQPRTREERVLIVPDQAPPVDRDGRPWWPSGWQDGGGGADAPDSGAGRYGSTRRIEREEDVFELLGLPFRPPEERNC